MEKQIAKLAYWLGIGFTILSFVSRLLSAVGIWPASHMSDGKLPISYWSFFDAAGLMFIIAIASSLIALINAQNK